MYNVVELISVVGIFVRIRNVSIYGIFNRLLRASLRLEFVTKLSVKKSTAAFSFKVSKDVV